MVDVVDKKTRSRMMSGIRGRDTKPEIAVRKALFAAGYRYRLHSNTVPGRPDVVLPRHRTVVLIHGCFWHRHAGCKYAYMPKSNAVFWKKKFDSNVARDRVVRRELKRAGWLIKVVWECEVNERRLQRLIREIAVRSNVRPRP